MSVRGRQKLYLAPRLVDRKAAPGSYWARPTSDQTVAMSRADPTVARSRADPTVARSQVVPTVLVIIPEGSWAGDRQPVICSALSSTKEKFDYLLNICLDLEGCNQTSVAGSGLVWTGSRFCIS